MPGAAHGAPGVCRVSVLLPVTVRRHVQAGLAPVYAQAVGVEAEVAVRVDRPVQGGVDEVVGVVEVPVEVLSTPHLGEGEGQSQTS